MVFNSFLRRNYAPIRTNGGDAGDEHGVRLKPSRSLRKSNESPEQKVVRLVKVYLEADEPTEPVAFTDHDARLASQIVSDVSTIPSFPSAHAILEMLSS